MGKIKLTELVLRDAHQSLLATRMLTSDMLPVAEKLDKVGYWSLEAWGGATFDTCVRFLNEDPWERLRLLKKGMPNTPIQMLLRGQNLLGYRNYADDVVEKFVELSAKNGVDVYRIFDALNDPRNLITSINAVKKAGKHAQATISYATTPFHTIDKFVELAVELKNIGADSICIKDMAGLLKPFDSYQLVSEIKKKVDLPLVLHSHATTGLSVATLLKGAEAGADILDTAISSMAMGTSHSPTETVAEMFKGTEFDTGLDIPLLVDIAAYFRDVRKKYKQFESSFLGADTRILLAQVPGGMLSNLESQLKEQNGLDRMDDVLKEIALVQKDFGYPPLVTPTSQIVGTQAVFNVFFGRYNKLTAESRNLLAGNYGRTPTQPNSDLVKKALMELNLEKMVECRPADNLPNELDKIESQLKEAMGIKEVSMEDVLTYAMFPQIAVSFFKSRDKGPIVIDVPEAQAPSLSQTPGQREDGSRYIVNVNGKDYQVAVRAEGTVIVSNAGWKYSSGKPIEGTSLIEAPVAGTILRLKCNPGDMVKKGDTVLIIESMKMELEIKSTENGEIGYLVAVGDKVIPHQPIAEIK